MDLNEVLASTASAQAQMKFQERMSNTAHQREVADLKAAGLNPVLSAGGSGASTPDGASGDYSAVLGLLSQSMDNSAKAIGSLGKSVESAIKAGLGRVDMDAIQAMSDLKSVLSSPDSRQDGLARTQDKLKEWFGEDTRIPNIFTGGTVKVKDVVGLVDALIPNTPWQNNKFWYRDKSTYTGNSAKENALRKSKTHHGTF